MAEVQKSRQLAMARKLIKSAVEASRIHFDKEERIVFPMAEKLLTNATLLKLGEAWAKRRDSASR